MRWVDVDTIRTTRWTAKPALPSTGCRLANTPERAVGWAADIEPLGK